MATRVIEIKKRNEDNDIPAGVSCCIITCIVIAFILNVTLPCVVLAYGSQYHDTMSCGSNVTSTTLINDIGISNWMITHGVIRVIEGICLVVLLIMAFTKNNFCAYITLYIFSIFATLFRFAWLIVGAVMFWSDCPHLTPTPVNDLMWDAISCMISL
jgi:hypothetical protein